MTFSFRTLANTGSLGSIILGIDYDPADPPPTTKSDMLNAAESVAGPVYLSVDTRINVSRMPRDALYVRTAPLAANLDVKTYDSGNLQAYVSLGGNTAVIGELFIEYVVDLFTPQLSLLMAPGSLGGIITAGGAVTPALPFGTTPTGTGVAVGCGAVVPPSGTELFFGNAGGSSVKRMYSGLTPGTMIATIVAAGTVFTGTPLISGVSNCLWTLLSSVLDSTSTHQIMTYLVNIYNSTYCWWDIDFAGLATTVTSTIAEWARN